MGKLTVIGMLLFNLSCFGMTVSIDVQHDPIVVHESFISDTSEWLFIKETVRIPLAAVSLSPGDTLLIHCTLRSGIEVQHAGYFGSYIILNSLSQHPDETYGSVDVDETSCLQLGQPYGLSPTHVTSLVGCNRNIYNDYSLGAVYDFYQPQIAERAMLKSFTISLSVPDEMDADLMPTDLFSGSIYLTASSNVLAELNLITVVPEPASLILMGVGTLIIRKRDISAWKEDNGSLERYKAWALSEDKPTEE